jgi:hypothetical protein
LRVILAGFTLERQKDGLLLQFARLALIVAAPGRCGGPRGVTRAPTPPWPEGPKSGKRRPGAHRSPEARPVIGGSCATSESAPISRGAWSMSGGQLGPARSAPLKT